MKQFIQNPNLLFIDENFKIKWTSKEYYSKPIHTYKISTTLNGNFCLNGNWIRGIELDYRPLKLEFDKKNGNVVNNLFDSISFKRFSSYTKGIIIENNNKISHIQTNYLPPINRIFIDEYNKETYKFEKQIILDSTSFNNKNNNSIFINKYFHIENKIAVEITLRSQIANKFIKYCILDDEYRIKDTLISFHTYISEDLYQIKEHNIVCSSFDSINNNLYLIDRFIDRDDNINKLDTVFTLHQYDANGTEINKVVLPKKHNIQYGLIKILDNDKILITNYYQDANISANIIMELILLNNDLSQIKNTKIINNKIELFFGFQNNHIVFKDNKLFVLANYVNDNNNYLYIEEININEMSVNQNIENLMIIFPNPSSERISLDLGGVVVVDLLVYDILGNEIMSISNYTNKNEIDISTLSIGTYTIQIQTSTGSISQRFVKY